MKEALKHNLRVIKNKIKIYGNIKKIQKKIIISK